MAEYISFQPSGFFNTKLYTGTGSSNAITGVGFQPDATWIKGRNTTYNHVFTDAVRGVTEELYPNTTGAEVTNAQGLTAFGADGFTVGTDAGYNGNTNTYASWNWKAGTTSGISGGTITPSAYSFNTTSGFSAVAYTGTGANATVPHGLGAVPELILVKSLNLTANWIVYQGSNTAAPETEKLNLNENYATSDNDTMWNDTAPTSSVFSLGVNTDVNGSGSTYIAYCFAPKKGYSHFGQYIGNGNANGPFVYLGFRPAWLMIKRTDSTGSWVMMDSKRDGYNLSNKVLYANTTDDEESGTTALYSNGFKVRETWADVNANTGEFIYAAFAEFPLVSSNDVPGVAR